MRRCGRGLCEAGPVSGLPRWGSAASEQFAPAAPAVVLGTGTPFADDLLWVLRYAQNLLLQLLHCFAARDNAATVGAECHPCALVLRQFGAPEAGPVRAILFRDHCDP